MVETSKILLNFLHYVRFRSYEFHVDTYHYSSQNLSEDLKNGEDEERDGLETSRGNSEVKESKGGIIEKKETLTCKDLLDGGGKGGNMKKNKNKKPNANGVDSSNALKLFLDHIPISSIPGINNSSTMLCL
ncbi:hypothetical protein ACSBR2_001744 [Camellia fascicularis]